MTMDNMQIRFWVGVVGNGISLFLFLSPLPTFIRILKNKSVEEFLPDPYLACLINCMLWIFYGLPINHPNSTLVITINVTGFVLELIYLIIFLTYGAKKHWKKIASVFALELIFMGAVIILDLQLFHTHTRRSTFVGIFCVVFGVIMYASPLTVMFKVVKTKSVEFMPFTLSLAGFLNGCCWTTYALLKFDLFILIANGTGAVLGCLQLILYGCYYSTTPKDSKKPPAEVQLEKIDVV